MLSHVQGPSRTDSAASTHSTVMLREEQARQAASELHRQQLLLQQQLQQQQMQQHKQQQAQQQQQSWQQHHHPSNAHGTRKDGWDQVSCKGSSKIQKVFQSTCKARCKVLQNLTMHTSLLSFISDLRLMDDWGFWQPPPKCF